MSGSLSITVEPENVDTDCKFVVAVRAKLDHGVAVNATAHLCLGLVAKAAQERPELLPRMSFLRFPDAGGDEHWPVSGPSLDITIGALVLERAAGREGVVTVPDSAGPL